MGNEKEETLKELTAENFPQLVKDTNPHYICRNKNGKAAMMKRGLLPKEQDQATDFLTIRLESSPTH